MTVRAVTPRVVAISGHLQFYRDADHFDASQDELVTGNPYDPEWPDKPLHLRTFPDRVHRGPGSGRADCATALSGAPETLPHSPDSGASDPSGGGARRSPGAS